MAIPPPVGECTPMPLATWRQALPVAADRGTAESECYRFTSVAAGTHLWRLTRESTDFRPVIEVFRENGTRAANATWGGGYGSMTLVAGHTYRVLISGSPGPAAPGYELGVYEVHGSGACPTQGSTAFADTGVQDAFVGGELHCRELSTPEDNQLFVNTRAPSVVSTIVYRAVGSTCSWAQSATICRVTGQGPYRMITRSGSTSDDEQAVSYETWVDDATAGQGCVPGAFTGWREVPAISAQRGRGEAECYLITPPRHGRYLVEVSQGSGDWQSRTQFIDPDGSAPAISSSRLAVLEPDKTYRLIVRGTAGSDPSYGLTVLQFDGSTGCRPVAADSWTAAPTAVSFPTGTEVDCLEFDEVADGALRVNITGAASQVAGTLFNSNTGLSGCYVTTQTGDCELSGLAPFRMIVNAGDERTHPPAAAQVWATNYAATDGCPTIPLAQWGEPLPVDLLRSDRPAECRIVTTEDAGHYLVRSAEEGPTGLSSHGSFALYTDRGVRATRGISSTGMWPFELAGQTAYRLIISGDTDATGVLRAGVHRLDTSCPAITETDWDGDPTRPSFAEGTETDCREVTGIEGSRLRVSLETAGDHDATLSGSAYDADGRVICRLNVAVRYCPMAGPAPYRLVTHARTPRTGEIWVHDLASDEGCQSLASTSAMSAAPVAATLPANRVVTCWTAPMVSEDRMWLSVASQDPDRGGPRAQFIGPDGILGETGIHALCDTRDIAPSCAPVDVGPHRVVVTGGEFTHADYRLALRRLNQPRGCHYTRAVAESLVLAGSIDQSDGLYCVQIPANEGDTWRFSAIDPRSPLDRGDPVHVYGPDGSLLCNQPGNDPCVVTETGDHTVVVTQGLGPGPFELRGTCLTPACGDGSLRLDSVTPDGVPAINGAFLTLRGRGLSPALDVRLVQGTTQVSATDATGTADASELGVTFDLRGRSGVWDVVISEPGAPEVRMPAAVRIEAKEQPNITAALVTRGVYTEGRFTSFVVEIENSGNVPVMGMPLVLKGFPEGTELVPQFPMRGLPGPLGSRDFPVPDLPLPPEPPLPPRPPDQPIDLVSDPDGGTGTGDTGTTIIIDNIPPKSTRTVKFKVKAPADGSRDGYDIEAAVPDCDTDGDASPFDMWSGASECMDAVVDVGVDALSNAVPIPCAGEIMAGATSVIRSMSRPSGASAPFQMSDVMEVAASTVSCGADLAGAALLTSVIGTVSTIDGVVGAAQTCFDWWEAAMESVSSIDPNELVGPAGGGPDRAMGGQGRHTFGVFFENMATATAPAQEVRISDRLDPAQYDLSSIRFESVAFGDTDWGPATPTDSLDHVLQLGDGLQLDVTASAAADGHVRWELLSQEVETGEISEDPFRGFLPPNVDGTEGQGVVWFSVRAMGQPDGAVLSSQAEIWFDLNPSILTNTWTNLVDTTAPTASVSAPATATGAFPVTWGGSDATSGVAGIDVLVSTDGGPAVVWQRDVAPGSATYPGTAGRTYRFTVTARDHAGLTSATRSATTAVGSTQAGGKKKPTVKVKARSPRKRTAVLSIRVLAEGKRVRKARLVIKDGRRTVRRLTAKRGVVKVRLRGLRSGRHRFTVVFKGNRTLAKATRRVWLRVR